MTKCTLRVIKTVSVPGSTTRSTSCSTSLPATVSSLRPQYSRARLVKEVGGRGGGDGEFREPWGVTCTRSGMIVITDFNNARFQMFTEDDLEHVRTVSSRGKSATQFWCPTGITTDNHGRIFIANVSNHIIQVVDELGSHLCMFGSEGTSPGQYNSPCGITMDLNQRLFVCDKCNYRVQVIAADGRHLSTLTQTGPAKLRATPWFISSDSHNHITVTDSDGNLYMFDDKGKHTRTLLCGEPGGFSRAGGTVTDAWGTLLVSDYNRGCVCVMGEKGQVSCRIGHQGQGPGQIGRAVGIALTNKGDLIVCDYGNSKILQYEIPTYAN